MVDAAGCVSLFLANPTANEKRTAVCLVRLVTADTMQSTTGT